MTPTVHRSGQFQFHLVRLKVYDKQVAMQWDFVSIPFSTIKSFRALPIIDYTTTFQFHLVRLKGCGEIIPEKWPLFQFHLVRLKAAYPLLVAVCYAVSIPFSTIKSSLAAEEDYPAQMFQFHLVRLKD